MLKKISQLYRCTSGIPAAQLLRRVELQIKRRILSSLLGNWMRPQTPQPISLKPNLPHSLFSPRQHLLERKSGTPHLSQLGSTIPLVPPINWEGDKPTLRHLDRLTLHYHEFLETLEFHEGLAIIQDWITRNNCWKKGYWLDSWNSYAISIRTVCWFQWLAEHRSKLANQELASIQQSLAEQLEFLLKNLETDICGNHLLKNIRCLLWASACVENPLANKLKTIGLKLLRRECSQQFLSDGMHFELSPAYHCQAFTDLLDCYVSLESKEAIFLTTTLEKAALALANLIHPDGLISLMSDGGLHMVYSPTECLSAWQTLSHKPAVQENVFRLPAAGYAGVRHHRSYLLFDAGASCADRLPAHGHGDLLSFEWDVDGVRCVVDPGVYEYESGPERQRNRSAFSHNVVIVDGWDQCEFVGSFRTGWRNHAKLSEPQTYPDGSIALQGEFTHHQGNYRHQRKILTHQTGLSVEDQVEGVRSTAVANLLINGAFTVVSSTPHSMEFKHDNSRVILSSPFPITHSAATWSPDFGTKLPATQVTIHYGQESGKFRFDLTVCT